MTVATLNNRVSYAGNGVTTAFSFPNRFLADADLVVLVVTDSTGASVTKTLTTHYTVSGAGGAAGGTVTMLTAPATGETLVIYRDPVLTQPIDLVEGDPLPVDTAVERGFDRSTLQIQRIRDLIDRTMGLPEGDTGLTAADMKLPLAVVRAGKFLAFDSNGKPTATAGVAGTTVVTPFMATVLDDATAAAALTTLGVSAFAQTILDDATSNAALTTLTVTRSGTGSVAVPALTKFGETLSITDFGGSGDAGVTDNGAALQKAHDALPADGGTIHIPPTATYYGFTTSVAFTKPVHIVGAGWYGSEFLTAVNGLTMITTTRKLVVEGVSFTASGAAVGTAVAIKTLATATNHTETLLFNCYLAGFLRCYWSERTAAFHAMHCRFAPSAGYGLYLENTTNPDEGDSFIHDNYFAGGAGDTSIYIASTSGLNLCSNKFNGPVNVHLDVAPTTNNVGNFLISNNSFEGHVTAAIRLIATTGIITKTVITGNQLSSGSATHIIVGNKAYNTVITGNSFNDVNAANGVGIDLRAEARYVTIVGNTFHQIFTAIKSVAAILGQTIEANRFNVDSSSSYDVTNFYLDGEDHDLGISGMGSTKELQVDRYITTASNAVYTDAFKFRGGCSVDVEVVGVVQGVGVCHKFRKVLIDGATVTDVIPVVSTGAAFDLQIATSGSDVVVGIKRNGATGTSVGAAVRVKASGYVRNFSKV
ncbi:MAG TPA: hypothetical protein VJ396_09310 [Acidiferrobacterales bacterium]|nr:hypothetical protein [Acidiferrobacterales bacterium]